MKQGVCAMFTISVSVEELDRILAALSMMQDVDDENGHTEEARRTRELFDRLDRLELEA